MTDIALTMRNFIISNEEINTIQMGKRIKASINIQKVFSDRFILGRCKMSPAENNIKTPTAFHAILAKERARVDRNFHTFSLVSIKLITQDPRKDSINLFVHRLMNQIRITDEIGWINTHTIGVLLFNSLTTEAQQFIERIQRSSFQDITCKYSIATYPEDNEHSHGAGICRKQCAYHHSMPVSTSLYGHQRATDRNIAKELYPVFFEKMPFWKRLGDVVLSTAALIVLSPLLLLISIAVKCTSKGPILFKQKRAGLGGVPFTFLKFRTMQIDAEKKKAELLQFNKRTGPVFKMENDPRITMLGKFLRKWSLDELPQFVNVLKGEMSLVGPRPPTLDEVEKYNNWHNYRLEMKPGITCIWQVYARHDKSFENWVRLDIKYRKEHSFLLDLKLLFMTIPAVLSRKGAC
jgi:lipopolysaccharide/colanic/teichoic acid biosynthesis glycosyltransferase